MNSIFDSFFRRIIRWLIFLPLFFALLAFTPQLPPNRLPQKEWLQYKTPEDAGFSSQKLLKARDLATKSKSANVLIIYKGAIVQAWGDASRRFCMHSSRKATQSSLIGIYASKGVIDINKTIGEYGIDEVTPLTDVEKQATVRQLMTGYSGIYLRSVAGGNAMPKRGSHKPGEHWFYNNWNYNALNTIFEQQTHVKLTHAFVEHIAQPIGMEDFVPHDAWYNYEEYSLHPVYHINMSARDMARFGLLYMNGGRWGEQQVVPEQWVKESLTDYTPKKEKYGSGYSWWMPPEKTFNQKCYTAEGIGGHALILLPEIDMIIVHRANTYVQPWLSVDWTQIKEIVKEILASRTEVKSTIDESKLITYEPNRKHWPTLISDDPAKTKRFEKYYHNDGDPVTILREKDGQLIVNIKYIGNFNLYPITDSTFFVEGKEEKIFFEYDDQREPIKAIFP
jgi:CubicO group peptidase (beta-lactamase class C family)